MGLLSRTKSWLGDMASWIPLGEGGARGGGYGFNVRKSTSKSLDPTESVQLSIAVNAAVNAICRNISKAKIRLFTKSGEEIDGGGLWELLRLPAPGLSQRKWLWEVIAWFNIHGEIAVWEREREGKVVSLLPLCPARCEVKVPVKPANTIDDVVQWRYPWADGYESLIRADHLLFDRLFNPVATSIRGLSPLLTGAVVVTGQVRAEQYNKTYFENSGIPSHILKLPDGVPEATRKDIERRWMSEYGVYGNNAHKVGVISGSDTEVIKLDAAFADAAFVDLDKQATLKVAQLYRVPAIEMGIYDKTRFDTASEERKLFAESTLLPQIDALTEALQHQLVDRHFAFTRDFTTTRPREGRKWMEKNFERAKERARGAAIVVLIDADTMPVMSDVRLAKMEHAEKLQAIYRLSANQTAEYLDEDLPDEGMEDPARAHVWIENKFVNITDPEFNKKIVPGLIPKPTPSGEGAPKGKKELGAAASDARGSGLRLLGLGGALQDGGSADTPRMPAPLGPEARVRIKAAEKFLRKLRNETVRLVGEGGELWGLSDTDARASEAGFTHELKLQIRQARFAARQAVKNHPNDREAAVAEVKAAFREIFHDTAIRKALGL
jgi:HK97 family phage portal protein